MNGKGHVAARAMLIGCVVRAAREMRDASRNVLHEEPEAQEAWVGLDEALTALDDFAGTSISMPDAKVGAPADSE